MEENNVSLPHIVELHTIVYQLISIDHPISNEYMAFTLLRSYLPSFHTSMVAFNYFIDELYMELICGQLVQ
jgi:hypothetical protein